MTRFFCIAMLTAIGLFLKPVESYACSSKSENTEITSDKQSASETEKKDCSSKEKGPCGKHGKDCDGKCGNPACHCPTHCKSFLGTLFAPLLIVKTTLSKPDFFYREAYYTSGFLAIWLPPKIG
ncbi:MULTISPECIES: hypothetical protein [Rhodonellum]|uniref:hypothetical protein n=1 Tax=Rhodonellum TaxID=336827 RepID=UPI0009DAA004|nr:MULTISPECIES: hypothetical protein [Rhodonellum]